jgi:LPXTG-site transpeptidase (sortase) family protein
VTTGVSPHGRPGGRHADPDLTSIIPAVGTDDTSVIPPVPAADETSLIPPVPAADETSLIPPVPDRSRAEARRAKAESKVYDSKAWRVNDRRKRSGGPVRTTARVIGEVLITLGLVVLLFAVYEVYGKTAIINSHQNQLDQQLQNSWSAPTPPKPSGGTKSPTPLAPPPGNAVARLYIPKLNMHWVVVEGVTLKDIRYAPGHYPGTALPGQVGNFALAGHRVPAIFWNLDQVHTGDTVVVETRDNWYVYKVTVNEIVTPHSVEVIAPTPDKPGVKATDAMMTMTTCNPKWDNYQRMVVHAKLVSTTPHSAGAPVALGS